MTYRGLNPFEKLTIPVDFLVNKYSNLNRKSMWLKPRKCAKLTLKNHEIKFAPLLSKIRLNPFEKLTIPVDFLVNKYSNLNRKSMWLKPRKCAKLTLKNHEIKFAPLLSISWSKIIWIGSRCGFWAKLTLKNSRNKSLLHCCRKIRLNPFEKLTIPVDFNKYSNLNRKSMWLKPRKCAKLTLKNQVLTLKIDFLVNKYSNLNREDVAET